MGNLLDYHIFLTNVCFLKRKRFQRKGTYVFIKLIHVIFQMDAKTRNASFMQFVKVTALQKQVVFVQNTVKMEL